MIDFGITEVSTYSSSKKERVIYPVFIALDNGFEQGIYCSDKEHAMKILGEMKLEIGAQYTVYFDPTVTSSFSDILLGIRKIEKNEQEVFEGIFHTRIYRKSLVDPLFILLIHYTTIRKGN